MIHTRGQAAFGPFPGSAEKGKWLAGPFRPRFLQGVGRVRCFLVPGMGTVLLTAFWAVPFKNSLPSFPLEKG